MAHLHINNNIGCGDFFIPGQPFAFGSIVLHANTTGRLDGVKSFAPNQVMTFGGLDYTVDSHGDLALSRRLPDNGDPKDPEDGEDSNYVLESKEDDSHGPEGFIVPEDPYEQEKFR